MSNKTVLITGSANRIGAEIARTLHADDMDIIIHYNRSEADAHSLANELNETRPDSSTIVQANLVETGATEQIINTTLEFKNRLDVLINNASSFYPTPINTTSTEQWEEIIGTNMKAPFFLSKQAAPHLKKQNGCIINITDIHADRPLRNHSVYSAAKSGLTMLTKTLAKELAPEIRVNGIAPGAILWPDDMNNETKEKLLSKTALKQKGNPIDIANAIRFLVRDADYMTGQILTIDGGRSLFS